MKRLSVYSAFVLFLLIGILQPGQAAQPRPGERLEYTFSYQGLFSGFIEIDIARAVFNVAAEVGRIQDREAYLTSLHLTTEPFGKAELIYPIRYRYRSWLEPDEQLPLLVSEYQQTDEIKEEWLWFDRTNSQGYRFVKREEVETPGEIPPELPLHELGLSKQDTAGLVQRHRQKYVDDGIWDYLSLLYRLRFSDLESGRVFELPLYNGKRIKRYRVGVERERLELAGWNRPAFKLSVTEVGEDEEDARTLVWISDDEERLPLRFLVSRTFGQVQGLLETGRPLGERGEGLSQATEESLQLVF